MRYAGFHDRNVGKEIWTSNEIYKIPDKLKNKFR
jgi:hypothetical protein